MNIEANALFCMLPQTAKRSWTLTQINLTRISRQACRKKRKRTQTNHEGSRQFYLCLMCWAHQDMRHLKLNKSNEKAQISSRKHINWKILMTRLFSQKYQYIIYILLFPSILPSISPVNQLFSKGIHADKPINRPFLYLLLLSGNKLIILRYRT